MNQTLLTINCFLTFFISFSQTEKRINGKISSEETALQNIDVVNMRTKIVATSDNGGRFSILAKTGDELYILAKNHIDRKIVVAENDFNNDVNIAIEKKPEELEEVKIITTPTVKFKVSQYEINQRDQLKLQNDAKKPVVQGVYTGQMVNGVDFMRIGKDLISLFKGKDKEKIPLKPIIIFKDYVKTNYDDGFFTNTLKLKKEQIYAFVDFCDADPNAKIIAQKNNSLAVMDFLIAKSKEFKKWN